MSKRGAETEPEQADLFAISRARAERFEPLITTGLRLGYYVTDGTDVLPFLELNMLNALESAAPDHDHTAFEITEHSPTRWTCRHRALGYVLKVWGWQRELQSQPQ